MDKAASLTTDSMFASIVLVMTTHLFRFGVILSAFAAAAVVVVVVVVVFVADVVVYVGGGGANVVGVCVVVIAVVVSSIGVATARFHFFVRFFLGSVFVIWVPSHVLFTKFFTTHDERPTFCIRQ